MYRVYANRSRTQAKKKLIIPILILARFSGKGRYAPHVMT